MQKTSKGFLTRIRNSISKLDRFPVTFQFRVANKKKYGTFLGGIWFLVFLAFSIFFMIKKTKEFFYWSNYTLKFVEKAVYPTPRMNFGQMNFNYALQITFENSTTLRNTQYKDLFIMETWLRQRKGNNLNTEKRLHQRPCKEEDFTDSNEDPLFKRTKFEDLTCLEDLKEVYLYGTHHDEEMTFVQNRIKINPIYLKDEEKLNNIFKNNLFKFRFYYIDALNDVSSLENPIFQKIDAVYNYLDLKFLKKIKIGFQEFSYSEDKNLFSHNLITNRFVKKYDIEESDVSIHDRINSELSQKEDFLILYLTAHNNVKIVTKTFENLPQFLGKVSANLSNILIWSSIVMNLYNMLHAKQYIMSKIMKYNDNITKKTYESVNYFTTKFNNQLIEEVKKKMPSIFSAAANQCKNPEDNNNYNNLISEENMNNSNANLENDKKQKKSIFDARNFLRKRDSTKAPGNSSDIELTKKKNDEILVHIQDPKNAQKERLNESNAEENPDEIIQKQNPNSIGFFEILLHVFCCGRCKDVEKKGKVFESANKIFHKNLDVINYMKKMQEIDIMKFLILDNETLDLMNFLSKPSVSIGQKPVSDTEYFKFFYPSEKVNSITFNNIDDLKISYDKIIKRAHHSNIESRILRLFHLQLQESNFSADSAK